MQTGRNNSKEALRTFSLDIPLPGIPKKDKVVAAVWSGGKERGDSEWQKEGDPETPQAGSSLDKTGSDVHPSSKAGQPTGLGRVGCSLGYDLKAAYRTRMSDGDASHLWAMGLWEGWQGFISALCTEPSHKTSYLQLEGERL